MKKDTDTVQTTEFTPGKNSNTLSKNTETESSFHSDARPWGRGSGCDVAGEDTRFKAKKMSPLKFFGEDLSFLGGGGGEGISSLKCLDKTLDCISFKKFFIKTIQK